MCEQAESNYLDGDVVWVKLGSCWWPGEVVGSEKLPPDVLPSFRKPPIAVVKFFQEDTYEYVKNTNAIYRYNCDRKNEFINKGLYMYRTKHGPMEKFPEDVIRAETAVGGDIEILTRDEFQEVKKESYAGLFGDSAKKMSPGSGKKGRDRGRESSDSYRPTRKITEKTNYKVHILVQGSNTPSSQPEALSTPSTSGIEGELVEDKTQDAEKPPAVTVLAPLPSTPTSSNSGQYSCHACSFSTTRLNVLILHNKTHSVTYTPYTPSPVRKKPIIKSTPSTSKTPKVRRPRKENSDIGSRKTNKGQKRSSEDDKTSAKDVKKPKTDEEIKSSLLADWDDIDDDESNDDSSTMVMAGSPEIPVAAESPAVPTPAELPSAQVPGEPSLPTIKKLDEPHTIDKAESSSDSKYEFCEDEDWPLEADGGRKIPRVKNPSKRKEDTKSISIDEDEVAREVAELLTKTTVPQLPSVPEPLKVEENFPEPSIIKSPDKNSEKLPEGNKDCETISTVTKPTKPIFKTKTFFRSRHSRSQDAIGKYVAEQLNAVERMDMSESEINGSDAVSSPEARDSPPIEPVKVARLAPKIQLKKMKAEAAQLREKGKSNRESGESGDYRYKEREFTEDSSIINFVMSSNTDSDRNIEEHTSPPRIVKSSNANSQINIEENSTPELKVSENNDNSLLPKSIQDVLYPTQEIKPVCEESFEENKSLSNVQENNKENNDDVTECTKHTNNETGVETYNDASAKLETDKVESITSDKFSDTKLQKSDDHTIEPFMNESTASAVDALLSVSRDADRVTKNISDDPPEDLFEDDNKDNGVHNSINGFGENMIENSVTVEKNDVEVHENRLVAETKDLKIDFHEEDDTIIDDDITKTDNQIDEKLNEVEVGDEVELNTNETEVEPVLENVPSESDLQIAETLINLPSTAIQPKTSEQQEIFNLPLVELPDEQQTEEIVEIAEETIPSPQIYDAKEEIEVCNEEPEQESISKDKDNVNVRFETEQEKSENLNAAQSLVQMSESIDHKINVVESQIVKNKEILNSTTFTTTPKNGIDTTVEQKVSLLSNDNNSEPNLNKVSKFDTSSSKLLKILEEPTVPKVAIPKVTATKQIIIPGKEKILNFDVAKSFIGKPQSPVIIRRTTSSKTLINSISDITTPDKIILSRNNKSNQDGSSIQTYTMQTTPEPPSDANTITIIQQKLKKVPRTPAKLQKIKQVNSLVANVATSSLEPKILNETQATIDPMFDINSMPIVLSDDLLTPESIEKMPIVMSDGNIITNASNPPKLVKSKPTVVESEKISITSGPSKPDVKTLVVNPVSEGVKITTPNILSKSSKLRGAKPMLVIDKTTGNKKIIVTKGEPQIKEIKQTPALLQQVTQNTGKADKFIILPSASSPRPGRTQKIVIDPQTGKAHVLVAKGPETSTINIAENKPVSAKLIPSSSNASTPGNTVMIITNAQGAQSKIVLTPEHEKILFPNKQSPNMSQLKTITQRISTNPMNVQKTVLTTVAPVKTQTRIVPKQKSAIITSKGQLIVGGRTANTTQNIAALPEIRPSPKRIVAAEPKKIIQTVQKTPSEPLIFLQQKSGAVVQLTASQFEHFKRTGQIIQKTPGLAHENKILVQKTKTILANESVGNVQKQRIRRTAVESPTPAKKIKHEIAIASALPPAPMPALTPLSHTITTATSLVQPTVTVGIPTTSTYPDLENFEELLPSTAISRQPEQPIVQVELPSPALAPAPPAIAPVPPTLIPAPAPLSDGQLLAVPGEHFGGPSGSYYLCVEDSGNLTPIDNRPLVLENNQLVPMVVDLPVLTAQPERRDILEAALANSDVFHVDTPRDEAPDFRDLNANVSVHCRVSETSTTLNQPIMTPVEVPTKGDSEPTVPSNLEDGLAVIGVTPHTVPTSLELPITVTDPRIAPKTTDPLSGNNYGTSLLSSPNTEMTFVTTEEVDMRAVGPISMPLLTDEESVGGGKSMPILTDADEVTERAVSSVESAGSPSSAEVEVRSEPEEGPGAWSRRLLTPGSDTSEASAEIPLQPLIQLSVNDLSRHS